MTNLQLISVALVVSHTKTQIQPRHPGESRSAARLLDDPSAVSEPQTSQSQTEQREGGRLRNRNRIGRHSEAKQGSCLGCLERAEANAGVVQSERLALACCQLLDGRRAAARRKDENAGVVRSEKVVRGAPCVIQPDISELESVVQSGGIETEQVGASLGVTARWNTIRA